MQRLALIFGLAASLVSSVLRAETASYTIAILPESAAEFEVQIQASHPGRISVRASWTGSRLLSFRLVNGSGGETVVRRSGPSPQQITLDVTADQLHGGPVNRTLEIRALAARERADGSIEVTTPDPPEAVAARVRAERNPPSPPPAPPGWAVAAAPPEQATPRLANLFQRIEDLRAAVYGVDPFTTNDACGWQDDLVRWLAHQRDRLAENAEPSPLATLRYVRRVADAVGTVDALRTSEDPLIAGPVPATPARRKAWLMARRDAIRPIERELDLLATSLRRGEVPRLGEERWTARLLACLTASERHFEAAGRASGTVVEGSGLAQAQWPRILAAARALDALTDWIEDPATP